MKSAMTDTEKDVVRYIIAKHVVSSGHERNYKFDRMDTFTKIDCTPMDLVEEIAQALAPPTTS